MRTQEYRQFVITVNPNIQLHRRRLEQSEHRWCASGSMTENKVPFGFGNRLSPV